MLRSQTVIDTPVPLFETLEKTSDLERAVQAREKGGKATAQMQAKFGRATYVSSMNQDVPPDPGAHALALFLWRLADGFQAP